MRTVSYTHLDVYKRQDYLYNNTDSFNKGEAGTDSDGIVAATRNWGLKSQLINGAGGIAEALMAGKHVPVSYTHLDLPPFIIKRLPVRLTFDNNYFNDRYQGIPIGGYNVIIENMLGDVEVELGVDFFANREELEASANKVVFTGMIDQYFDYKHGELEYRSLRFEHEVLDEENYQGNAVVNYTEREIPYTRIIEHKHFEYGTQPKTVITREYPADWKRGDEPYYPINDEKNNAMFAKYQEEAEKNDKVIFCGRLADYKYYDMHVVIERALEVVANEFDWKKP